MTLVLASAVALSAAATVLGGVAAVRFRSRAAASAVALCSCTGWAAWRLGRQADEPEWPLQLSALLIGVFGMVTTAVLARAIHQRAREAERGDALLAEITRSVRESSSQIDSGEIRVRELTRVLPVGIFEADLSGGVLHLSRKGREITGLGKDQARARRWLQGVHPDDRPEVSEAVDAAVAARQTIDVTCRFVGPRGAVAWVQLHAELQRDAQERAVGYVGFVMDVTDRRRSEEERRRLDDRVRQTQKLESLAVLAGGIAHDFNNLLVGMLGNAGLALDDLEDRPEAREAVRQIEAAALRASELTEQMLAYSGKGKFVVEPTDLSRLVRDSRHLLEITTVRGTRLQYALQDDLPSVEADATQLRQVLMNLATNASESYGDQPGDVIIRTGVTDTTGEELTSPLLDEELPGGRYVYLEVEDHGSGMDATTRERLFDPFFTTKFTGRGLGLAATLGIVRGHRGAIHVDTEPDRGTRVRVLVEGSAAPAIRPARASEPDASFTGDGRTVMVVDDEDMVRNMASRILRQRGFEVVEASGGPDAIRLFEERPRDISVVLLDMVMPGQTGPQVLEDLKRIRPDVRVLLSSGYSETYAKDGLGAVELAGFIQKPYRPVQLVDKIREVLDG